MAKVIAFFFIFVWLRGTLPRLRYDQFMKFGWKVLIPASLFWIMVASSFRLMSQRGASKSVVIAAAIGVVIILLAAITLFDRSKEKSEEREALGDVAPPSFPVPQIPSQRAEQLHG